MNQIIDDIPAEDEFDLDLVGTFGRFQAQNSFPVEYFQTSLRMPKADTLLKFARDIEMEELNFDLLMQRDIDEGRVRDKIIPYLTQSIEGGIERPLFFPPLLVALVPVSNQEMKSHYGSPEVCEPHSGFVGLRWLESFRIYGKEVTGNQGTQLTPSISERRFNSNQTVMSLRQGSQHEHGVDLVVIDGQHRLRALKLLLQENRAVVSDLDIPVCILYPPFSNETNAENENVPTVPRVFRSLFVDVNSTMEVVGGHFTILLSDKNIGDIACRGFCDFLLSAEGRVGLGALEWNTRTKKNANNVTKAYTISTIGIINRGLYDYFKADMIVYYMLGISDADDEIFQVNDEETGRNSKIKWDKFSYAQSSVLAERCRNELAPILHKLFFQTAPFSKVFAVYERHLNKLLNEKSKGDRKSAVASSIVKHVLDYVPLPEGREEVSLRFGDFVDDVRDDLSEGGLELARKALFQRAVLGIFSEFLRLGLRFQWHKSLAEAGFLEFINSVFEEDMTTFSSSRVYMQHTVFNETNIITREETRRALYYLLLSHLLNEDIRNRVLGIFEASGADRSELSKALHSLAFTSAGHFIRIFRKEREKHFRKNYEFSYGIPREEREQLKLLEMKQSSMELEVQRGDRSADLVDKAFDKAIEAYVSDDVIEMESELKKRLKINIDLLEGLSEDDESDPDDES